MMTLIMTDSDVAKKKKKKKSRNTSNWSELEWTKILVKTNDIKLQS